MAQIAFSSGFKSIRRFNGAFRHCYGKTPSQLRQNGSKPRGQAITLRLDYRPPYDWSAMCEFLALRSTSGVETVEANCYVRSIVLDGHSGIIRVSSIPNKHALQLQVNFPDTTRLLSIVQQVRQMFDLDANPMDYSVHLGQDLDMKEVLSRWPGLRIPGTWDVFELAVRAILGQQISVKAASTLAGRLAKKFGQALATPYGKVQRVFPGPERLVKADLAHIGIISSRANSIHHLSQAVLNGKLSLTADLSLDEGINALKQLPGIGDWTAHYIAMRGLKQPDAFPASDLGLLRAASSDSKQLTPKRLVKKANNWRPWRAYAAIYLWKKYANKIIEETEHELCRN